MGHDDVRARIEGLKRVQGARTGFVGLWWQSRGATMALMIASTGSEVQVVVPASAACTRLGGSGPGCLGCPGPPEMVPLALAGDIKAPVLIMHGTQRAARRARLLQEALGLASCA